MASALAKLQGFGQKVQKVGSKDHYECRTLQINMPTPSSVDVKFDDIKLQVTTGFWTKKSKTILKGVSGVFRSGELTAIMGPSGAGKSSLMNALTGFFTTGVSGTISAGDAICRLGGKETSLRSLKSYRKKSCYILQDDRLNPLFTVLELMKFAADMKLGHSFNEKLKLTVIREILDTLGLSATEQTRCGCLSGGQRKRLSIAVELIDNPPVLFLDEPTTGLDSLSSAQCIEMLRKLARNGRTVICTIHQPSASVYMMFDQEMLRKLARNGRTVICTIHQPSASVYMMFDQDIMSTERTNCDLHHTPALSLRLHYMMFDQDITSTERTNCDLYYTPAFSLRLHDGCLTRFVPPPHQDIMSTERTNCDLHHTPALGLHLHDVRPGLFLLLIRISCQQNGLTVICTIHQSSAFVYTMFDQGILRKLARNGRTVICTIHQPSASVYMMFDQGILRKLARNGRTVICTIHQPSASVYMMFDQDIMSTERTNCDLHTTPAFSLRLHDVRPGLFLLLIRISCQHNVLTVICTIHQPSASVYMMFDQVYLLAEGMCVYHGAASNTVSYFANIGFQCPKYHNPADYVLEIASNEHGCHNEALASRAKRSESAAREKPLVGDTGASNEGFQCGKMSILVHPPTEIYKFGVVVKRCLKQQYRDWTVTHLRVLLHIVVGVLIGLFYEKAGSDGSKTINNIGYLIICAVYLTYTSLMPAVLRFPQELPVLKKENFNNWYSLSTYYLAVLVTSIPIQILYSFVYSVPSYILSGQPLELQRFVMFMLVLATCTLLADAVGNVIGTCVNPINGTFFGAITTCAMLVFAGFLVLLQHMSPTMRFISYFSFLRYAFEGLVLSVYAFERPVLECPLSEPYCHYKYPKEILREFSFKQDNYFLDLAVLLLEVLVLRVIAYLTLRRAMWKSS
ncbi:ABC-2 type transporter domain-containing protein [Phthorimaea operculella]|nr:ABC-2 type transporter domain-containing protein [Phthorimaea operculella]